MALGKDTQAKIAAVYPNSYHLFPKLEKTCTVIKYENKGKSKVEFTASGLNRSGQIIVKCFQVLMTIFCQEDDEPQAI